MLSRIAKVLRELFVEGRWPDRVVRAVDRALRWCGIPTKRITVEGLVFHVRRVSDDEAIVRHVVETKEYFTDHFQVEPTDTVVDIGGNIGSFAVLAADRARQGRVFSFEPIPANYDLLKKNIAANGFTNVQTFCAAVMDEPGSIEMFISPRSNGGHTIKRLRGNLGSVQVAAVSLGQIMSEHQLSRIDFLKLDCEGAEFPILLQTPTEVLAKVRRLALEYHVTATPAEKVAKVQELISHLESVGFRLVKNHNIETSWEGLLFMERS